MKFIFGLILALSISSAKSQDLTGSYEQFYKKETVLNSAEIEKLKHYELILIPGIVSEAFSWSDPRGLFDFSLIFKNYFGAQQKNFRRLGLNVTVLPGSSWSIHETFEQIDEKVRELEGSGREAIFITHSLGGLVLLDYLVKVNPQARKLLKGILFLQPPFYGSPIASVYFKNPYHAQKILGPLMPLVHTSEETVKYLTLENRQQAMKELEPELSDLTSAVAVVTAGGTSRNFRSLFRPSINIMARGCPVLILGKCRSRILYPGPYDDSDGMVPFENSKLPGVPFVQLKGVDHGETVVSMPYKSVRPVRMTDSLLKLLLQRMQPKR